jgi:hypothetical protein
LIEDRIQISANLGDLVATYPRTPSGAWLPVDRASAAAHRLRLQGSTPGSRIFGLAWRTTSSSLGGLEPLRPLLEMPGVRWVALPMGTVSSSLAQVLSAPDAPLVFEPGWLQGGLGSMAESLAALDLVVSIEDLAATLAGAVGCPVWKISAAADHWSWLADGHSSKWHPTARIFRTGGTKLESVSASIRPDLENFASIADQRGVPR